MQVFGRGYVLSTPIVIALILNSLDLKIDGEFWRGEKKMKVCPTCQKQYPNGFQYCPNDTELLLTAEEYLRRTLPVSVPVVPPAITRVEPPAPSVTEKLDNEAIRNVTPAKPSNVPTVPSMPSVQSTENRTQPITQPIASLSSVQQSRKEEPSRIQVSVRPADGGRVRADEKPVANTVPMMSGSNGGAAVGVDGMSLLLPTQGGIFKQMSEGAGVFFNYFGKNPKIEASEELFDNRSLPARIKEGFSIFFQYFGKKAQAGGDEFLVPESGSIAVRLKESFRTFVDDFGKKPPQLIPGQMGLLADEPILTRFGREVKTAAADFRSDPRAFVRAAIKGEGSTKRRQRMVQAGVASAVIAYAFVFVAFIVGGLIRFGKGPEQAKEPELELHSLIMPASQPITKEAPKEAPKGKGGFTGGSKPKPQQAHGGGGGGREQPQPPSQGRPPQMALTPQIIPPNPEPPKISNPKLPVPMTVYGDPKALPPNMKGPIGDPRGIQGPPSSGPGSGDGIGTGKGTGVGPGDGGGVGPGRGGNAGGGNFDLGGGRGPGGSGGVMDMGRDGVGRIVILYKEKARYTEEARQNKVQGTVVLSAVFTSDGRVTQVRVIRGLPDGLTEKAIEAAQKIKFQPATKSGQAVTVRGQLEFTFNLY